MTTTETPRFPVGNGSRSLSHFPEGNEGGGRDGHDIVVLLIMLAEHTNELFAAVGVRSRPSFLGSDDRGTLLIGLGRLSAVHERQEQHATLADEIGLGCK